MSVASTRSWLVGPLVAVATPFTDDLALDLDALRANIEAIVERGIRTGDGVLLVAGAAGEFPVLSADERIAVMRASVDAAAGRVPVMTSVQHTDTREIVTLLRAAADVGIAGVQLGVTYYYPAPENDLYRLLDLASRASTLPIMVYSTWWEGGLTMTPPILRRLAEVEHVEAVKWSAPDFDTFTAGVAAIAEKLVVIDNQAMHVWGHLLGTRGFVTHVGNFWPEYVVDLWHELERGDYQAATRRIASFKWDWADFAGRVVSESGGEGPFIKAALDVVGLRGGPPRPPSARAGQPLMEELRTLFLAKGVPGTS